ncbi:MAG: LysM peptidoglycan-binding domain-containing protein [Victivallaceae bacterium]|nr:LysM peptidoglycan-binding domain-containing protein [Victivallaceae bacterium]
MKSYICLTVLALLLAVAGCAPRLAQTPLGTEEKRWEEYIKKSYPAWKAPQTVPPVSPGTNTEAPVPGLAAPKAGALETLPVENDNTLVIEDVIVKDNKGKVTSETIKAVDIKEKNKVYVVQKNDTLWKIAKKLYNDGTQWKKIQAANDDILKGTSRVIPGMTLRIP